VTDKTDHRPISPYLIGPYYKPQLTSMLSIASRLMGIFLTAVTAPLMAIWLLALAAGPEPYGAVMGFLGSVPGVFLSVASLACLCYHLCNGIRHLVWDTRKMLSLGHIYASGYIMVACATALFALTLWQAVS
jgi:succinate dehydrogenase / fumarate reductase cytochrome b subunit